MSAEEEKKLLSSIIAIYVIYELWALSIDNINFFDIGPYILIDLSEETEINFPEGKTVKKFTESEWFDIVKYNDKLNILFFSLFFFEIYF